MKMVAVATLLEDSNRDLIPVQIYNVPRVHNLRDAQGFLPKGKRVAVVEPYFKVRSDGTLGIRVDNPEEFFQVMDEIQPSATQASDSEPTAEEPQRSPEEARLEELVKDGHGIKKIHQKLKEEGHEVGLNRIRRRVAAMRGCHPTEEVPSDGAHFSAKHSSPSAVSASAARDQQPAATLSASSAKSSAVSSKSSAVSDRQPACALSPPSVDQSAVSTQQAPSTPSAPTNRQAASTLVGVLGAGTKVQIEGLRSEAGQRLNGKTGFVTGCDLESGRVLVDVPVVGEKLIDRDRLVILRLEAPPLPFPVGPIPSIPSSWRDHSLLDAIVLGQSLDTAFLSHTMPLDMRREVTEQASANPDGLCGLVLAFMVAARKAQRLNPLAEPNEYEDKSQLSSRCDAAVAKAATAPERFAAVFFRGTLAVAMSDWHQAGKDLRDAYVASEGRAPWILLRASWAMASCTDGVSKRRKGHNYAEGQLMLELLLKLLGTKGRPGDSCDVHSCRAFALWQLAQVLYWRLISAGPRGLWPRIRALKDLALKAEKEARAGGIMNCLARDTIIGITSRVKRDTFPVEILHLVKAQRESMFPDVPSDSDNEVQGQPTPTEEECFLESQMTFLQMQAAEIDRMEEDQKIGESGNLAGLLTRSHQQHLQFQMRAEKHLLERKKTIELQQQALRAKQEAVWRAEAELTEECERLRAEASALQGDRASLEALRQEREEVQTKAFEEKLQQLRQRHEAELAHLEQQKQQAIELQAQELAQLLEGRKSLQAAFDEAMGDREAEATRWQRDLASKEKELEAEKFGVSKQLAELERMQQVLKEKNSTLEAKDRQLQQERAARQQLLDMSELTPEFLRQQRAGRRSVLLHSIRFTQDSVSSWFRDGRSIADTTKELKSGRIQVRDLPMIRTVDVYGVLLSLDNRRLRCLQEAFPKTSHEDLQVEVMVESLASAEVRAEFQRKFTSGTQVEVRAGKGRGKR